MKPIIKYTLPALIIGAVIGIGIMYAFRPKAKEVSNHQHEHSAGESITYTCSMHPQIRQNEMGICPICEMDLTPLTANSSSDPLVLEMTPEAVKLANIETTIVGMDSQLGQQLSLSGKLKADQQRKASQVAHIPGRIEELLISFDGQKVEKGEVLASIYSPELINAQRELMEAKRFHANNPGLLKAARNKLSYWKIPIGQINEMEINGRIQRNFPLLSDVTGVVSKMMVNVGDHLEEGEILFEVTDLDQLWVEFDVYEKDLALVREGNLVRFTTPALPGKTFSTRINFIDPMINPATRVATVRGNINNKSGQFKPEMLIEGMLQTRKGGGQQIRVPQSAVLWTGTRSVVYVKVPETDVPSFMFREVTLGKRVGEDYLVEKGLEAGEEVVTYGSFSIDAAAQLNNQASMMNRDVLIQGEVKEEIIPDFKTAVDDAFQDGLRSTLDAYLQLKDAFVATDAAMSQAGASAFLQKVQMMNTENLDAKAKEFWEEQEKAFIAHGQRITTLGDVERQRKQFDFLSQALIKTAKAFGVGDGEYYIQHCPMAFNDTGADWISNVEEIRNPYFGDVMLKCGFVEEELD